MSWAGRRALTLRKEGPPRETASRSLRVIEAKTTYPEGRDDDPGDVPRPPAEGPHGPARRREELGGCRKRDNGQEPRRRRRRAHRCGEHEPRRRRRERPAHRRPGRDGEEEAARAHGQARRPQGRAEEIGGGTLLLLLARRRTDEVRRPVTTTSPGGASSGRPLGGDHAALAALRDVPAELLTLGIFWNGQHT